MEEDRRNDIPRENEMPDEKALDEEAEGESESETEPEDNMQALKTQLEEFKDKYLRAYAEMDNMKKRLQREKQEIVKYGTERLLRDFLLVYDAVEKSITMALDLHPDDEDFIQGLRMTEKLLLETLKKNNVEPIETQNMPFDPNYHEAMMQVAKDDVAQGMVVDEIEKGFLVHDRVLRPAKVTVSG
jgi:molecular chaperone GrpE